MLNIETIKYLINYFKSTTELMGKKEFSVSTYRKNTYDLVKIGQLGYYEVKAVEKLLGMENTDNLKWDITDRKLYQFEKALNRLLSFGFDSESAIKEIKELKKQSVIEEMVYYVLLIMYEKDGYEKIDMKPLKTVVDKRKELREKEEEKKRNREALERNKRLESARQNTTYDSCGFAGYGHSYGSYGGGRSC